MPRFYESTRKHKKYMVKHNNKWIHFGDKRYQHYQDATNLKLYSDMNHMDKDRRRSYRARASAIRDGDGNLTYKNKNSPNYWSYHYLW